MNRIFLYCLFLLSAKTKSEVWEFGNDAHDSQILANYKGEGPVLEKFKKVEFFLPHCYYALYAKIEVNNPVMTPKVVYNWEENSAMFQYKETDEESVSKYSVIVKGKYQKKCKHGTMDDVKIRPDIAKPPILEYLSNS